MEARTLDTMPLIEEGDRGAGSQGVVKGEQPTKEASPRTSLEEALCTAAERGQIEEVRRLAQGASPGTLMQATSSAVLGGASFEVFRDLFNTLPDKHSAARQLLFDVATSDGTEHVVKEIIQVLVGARADPNERSTDEKHKGKSALQLADCCHNQKLLVLAGGDLNTLDWPAVLDRTDESAAVLLRMSLEQVNDPRLLRELKSVCFSLDGCHTVFFAESKLETVEVIERISQMLFAEEPFWLDFWEPFAEPRPRVGVLYSLKVKGPHSTELLRALGETQNLDALDEVAAIAIVQHAWLEMEMWYVVEVLWAFGTLLTVIEVTARIRVSEPVHSPWVVFLAVGVVKRALEEFAQCAETGGGPPSKTCGQMLRTFFLRSLPRYVFNRRTVIDWFFISAFAATVVISFTAFDGLLWERTMLSCAGGAAWFQALYVLRGVRAFGRNLLPIIRAAQDSLSFAIVMFFSVAGFTHALYCTRIGETSTLKSLYPSVIQMFRLGLMGDFELDELEGSHPREYDPETDVRPLVHILFYASVLAVNTVLMNLLIGVLGINYELHQAQIASCFTSERASLVVDMRLSPFRRVVCWFCWAVWRRSEWMTKTVVEYFPYGWKRALYVPKDCAAPTLYVGIPLEDHSTSQVSKGLEEMRRQLAALTNQIETHFGRGASAASLPMSAAH